MKPIKAFIKKEDNPMKYYIGLDVSNIETSICIMDHEGNIVKEAKVGSDPDSLNRYFEKTGLQFEQIGLEAGALSHWLVTSLRKSGWNVTCIDSRFMAAILATNVNKTDRNDARAIANAMRCKNYKEVHIKSVESIKTNSLLTARKTLVHQKTHLYNVVRGILKTFGIKLPKGLKSIREAIKTATAFDDFAPNHLKISSHVDWETIEPLILCHEHIEKQLEVLEAKVEALAKNDSIIQRFITHPGVGIITAVTYKAEIDDPTRFKKSRSVGAYLGMTPRQFSSGETIKQGRVSKHGSNEVRALLHEAGMVLITRTKAKSKLKTWGLKKKQKLKTQKASMAVGRKIAINLHRMWIDGKDFDPQMDVDGFCPEETRVENEKEMLKERKQLATLKKSKLGEAEKKKRRAV
jgi:transposase